MKKISILLLWSFMMVSTYSFGQGFCITQSQKSNAASSVQRIATQPCKLYQIKVYIHRVNNDVGNGYGSSIDNVIMGNLNTSFNSYGIFFSLSGSRIWYENTYANPNTNALVLQGLPNNSSNGFQSDAINIYVLPANSQIQGGFVPNSNKQILMIGGTRSVSHCQAPSTVQYIIASSKVVSHEMGHCFGLLHTFDTNGDDGLSDTPIDNITTAVGAQGCINTTNCQFTGSCSTCTLTSNPTTNMNNFMSYTNPPCMSYFSPMQLDVMRNTLNTSLQSVVSSYNTGSPSLMNIKYDNSYLAYTVNSVSAGYHSIQTNELPETLTQPISWMSSSNVSWGVSGMNNVNGWFSFNSGQSSTFNINATNICGSSARNVTFVVRSSYRIFSSANVKKDLTIEFDNIEYSESLPQSIKIFDEKSTKEEKEIFVRDQYDKKQLIEGKRLNIDVSSLSRGNKILHFYYNRTKISDNNKVQQDYDIKVERVILVN
jgi:Pregnancy-associated plasma protein-A